MNWISNYIKPSINSLFSRREVPDNLWRKCDECGSMLFHRELADSLNVCLNCQHHMPISPRARFDALFDGGVWLSVEVPDPVTDPLMFRDQKRYGDRMRDARRKTGEHETMLVAEGRIGGAPAVAAAADFGFMGGSMGMHVGNAIVAAAEKALERRCPLIIFSSAGGPRREGGSLRRWRRPGPRVAVKRLREGGCPTSRC